MVQEGAQHASPPLRFANGLTVRSTKRRVTKGLWKRHTARKPTPGTHPAPATRGPAAHPRRRRSRKVRNAQNWEKKRTQTAAWRSDGQAPQEHFFSVFSAVDKLKQYAPACATCTSGCFCKHEALDHVHARFLDGNFHTEVTDPSQTHETRRRPFHASSHPHSAQSICRTASST